MSENGTSRHGTTALVVYESMFGNTKAVAETIAEVLRKSADVAMFEVADAPNMIDSDIGLVIVAAPTHAFSLSGESTRRDAGDRGDLVSKGRGVREWIADVQRTGHVRFATVDTKVRKPLLPGSAAKAAAKRLRNKGWTEIAKPTSFFVDGVTGPLLEGELDRAGRWARQLPVSAIATA